MSDERGGERCGGGEGRVVARKRDQTRENRGTGTASSIEESEQDNGGGGGGAEMKPTSDKKRQGGGSMPA